MATDDNDELIAARLKAIEEERSKYSSSIRPGISRFDAYDLLHDFAKSRRIPCQCPESSLGKKSSLDFDQVCIGHVLYKHPRGRKKKAVACEEHYQKKRGERILWIPRALLSPHCIYMDFDGGHIYEVTPAPHHRFVVIANQGRGERMRFSTAYPVDLEDKVQHDDYARNKMVNHWRLIWTKEDGPL